MEPTSHEAQPTTESPPQLTIQEQQIVAALQAANGRVVGRTELARAAGIAPQGRRIDVLLVNVRRTLGADSIVNVRNRGWRLTNTDDTRQSEAAAS
jgi:DNA-binding response OmpR family regulator